MRIANILAVSIIAFAPLALAQAPTQPASAEQAVPSQTTTALEPMDHIPTFHVTVVSRTAEAVNYRHRGGATKVDFRGTDLMPAAHGQAKVESKQGYIEIEVEFDELQKPTTFGNEYLTYILWAVTPEGRSVNLGEVLLNGKRSKLDVTTDLQAFALVVTAEPYYAVRQPSNVVVLENVVRADTRGTTEAVSAKYDLLERGGYLPTGYTFDPVVLNAKLPLEFYEARNALRIAKSEGADVYAADSYQHAVELMKTAEDYATRKNIEKKSLIAAAREAVQTAEDARAIAVTKMEEVRLSAERQAAADAQARSQAQTDDAIRQKQQADADAAQAKSDMAANQEASAAAQARSQAEADDAKRQKQQADADAAKAQLESEQAKSAMAANQEASAAALAKSQADAEQARLAALAASEADAERARLAAQQSAQQAETEKAAMRTRLADQLNRILQTRDSARGLIVSMSDVLFDTGKYSLKPGAREKLAKVAGILLAYPGLNIAVGGYTDNVGSEAMNQTLSEHRAAAVRDYLVQQGVAAGSVTASGMGEGSPVATNENAAGRQQNRRVELVVSGESIGVGTTPGGSQ